MRGRYDNELLLRRPRVGADPDPRFAALRRAVHAVFDFHDRTAAPWYVYAETAYGPEVSPHASREMAFDRARLRETVPGEVYVAVFDVTDPLWPDPVFTRYRPASGSAVGATSGPVTSPSQVDPWGGPVTSPSQHEAPSQIDTRVPIMPPEYAAPPPDRLLPGPSDPRAYRAAQYQSDINRETDLLFWSETKYFPGRRLDPRDPADQVMIPRWLKTRERVTRKWTPQMLRRSTASHAVFDAHLKDPAPYFVYSSNATTGEQVIPFDDAQRAWSYVSLRLKDSDYVAFFSVADPKWASPTYEAFPLSRVA